MEFVLKNYIKSFTWNNIKERYINGNWFSIIYLCLIMPLILSGQDEDNSSILCLLIMLPNIFAMFASILFPSILPKLMYLCPMSKEMRKDYLIKACMIRTAVPVVFTILMIGILLFIGWIDWICSFGILLNNTIFAVFLGSGINLNGYGKRNEKDQKAIPMDDAFSLYEFGILFSATMISLGYSAVVMATDPLWVRFLFIGITLLVPLSLTISYLKYWPSAVENALTYENYLKKPTKLKK